MFVALLNYKLIADGGTLVYNVDHQDAILLICTLLAVYYVQQLGSAIWLETGNTAPPKSLY